MVPGVPALEVPAPTLDPAELAAVAGRLASFANRWSAMAAPHPDRRWYARLHREAAHDVWLLGWDQAQGIDLHDHGGSRGAFHVVEGTLVEAHTDLADPAPLRTLPVGTGEGRQLPATRVHQVWNPGPGQAVSVHVYSPPLSSMTFYDDRPAAFLVPLRTDAVEGAPEPGGAR